jgi:hypothetical protein
MRRLPFLLISLFLSLPVFSADPAVRQMLVRYRNRPATGRVLAVPSQSALQARSFHSAAAMTAFQAASSALERTAVVDIPAGADLQSEMAAWRARADVEFVEPNYRMYVSKTSSDTYYSLQWALKNTGQTGGHDSYDPASGTAGSDVDAEGAWDIQTGSNTIVVAIIDAGIAVTHPDLAANMLPGKDFGDNDNNPDDTCSNATPAFDSHGHGTHVTGIAGAVGNNGVGVTGLSWDGKILPLKVADSSCAIFTDAVVKAIIYASTAGARVINMSLGGENSTALTNAITAANAANIVMVAAAGNEGTEDFSNSYPAADSRVIAVAATDRTDHFASFSNRGTWITLSAPGVGILSTYPTALGSYAYLSGTSMASPLVAGAAALLLSDNPALTPADIKARLIAKADNIDALNPSLVGKMGAGRLNVLKALFSIDSVTPSTAPNTGSMAITTVTLNGFNFTSGMTVRLERGTQTIAGTGLGISTVSVATVTFNVTGRPGGRWDVVLEKPSGATTRLEDGFAVLSTSFNVLALDPAQAYTSTISVVQGTHTVVWPAGVFSQAITLDVDAAPTLPAVNTAVDPYAATGVGMELTPSSSSLTFQKAFTLSLGYRLTDLPNPSNETALTLARYNENTLRWEPLPSVVDTTARTVTASISHLSIFAILQHTASVNLNRAIAFPNPFRAELNHQRVIFDFLTAGSKVRIYDVTGAIVRDLIDDNNDGQIIWTDMKNDSGDDVASGVYFYLVTDPSGNKEKGRIGVIR